jgi:dephospho-CoA kinase
MKNIIIGLTGTLGAGKGTVAEYIKQKGFKHYSVRAYLIEEVKRRDLPVNRDNIRMVGNDLRKKNSPSFLVEQLYERAKKEGESCVIESIRTPGEVKALRERGKFYLFAVDANPKIRYKRILKRGSETDHVSYEEFIENEKREMKSTDPNKQNVSKCIEAADYKIKNDGSLDELYVKVEKIITKII